MPETRAQEGPPDFLRIHAQNQPDKLAVIGTDRELTFAELYRRSRLLARGMYDLGLRPGAQAAVMCTNQPERIEIVAALSALKVGSVPVPYQMKTAEIAYIVENSGAQALFVAHELADRIAPFKQRFPGLLPRGLVCFGGPPQPGTVAYQSLLSSPSEVDLDALPPSEKAASTMIYTSGTTGRPKGAARAVDAAGRPEIMAFVFELIARFQLGADEVHLICCPMYHSAPMLLSMLTFVLGGTRVLQPRFDAEQFLRLVEEHRVTSTHLVPTMVRRLLAVPTRVTDALDLSSLRTVICGAAPLLPRDKLAFLDRFGPILFEYYGSTEAGMNTIISPAEMRERPASVGKALDGNQLKILDGAGNEVPDGTSGMLYIRNPMMMDGYHGNQQATQEIRRDGFLTVGDVAIRDSEGYITIVDRAKDMIIRGGVNIYPAEIELVLSIIPGIADAAVVGKPDPEYGEIAVAFVVLDKGARLDEQEIRDRCREEMADNKVPASVVFIDEIQRSPTGKVLKRLLREALR